jgi:segregation and condensation protein B
MLKNKLEALLFSSGRKMDLDELSKLIRTRKDRIKKELEELKEEYDQKESSTMLVNEGDFWKLTVREQYLPLVRNIVTETELSKTILETLAVIAFKYPIKQSDLIKIRTNKAYDHLRDLQEMGYITRQKHGRSNLIKLTQKFFEYFDLAEDRLKEQFQDFKSIAKAIEDKERDIEETKQKQREEAQSTEEKEEQIKKDIESMDEPEKLGDLEVVDEPSEEELEKERERINKLKEEDKVQAEEKQQEEKTRTFEGPGIKVTPEMEKEIDKKVENIVHPKEEDEETKEEETENQGEDKKEQESKNEEDTETEPKDLLEASMEEKDDNKESKEEKQ